jgi:DNA-binding transcriptional MerR regulator
MSDLLSAAAAADALAVPKTTVVGWLRSGVVQAPTDERGRYRLDENTMGALRRVASLRAAGSSLASIRRRFTEDGTLTVQQPQASADGPGEPATLAILRDLLEAERNRSAALSEKLEALSGVASAWRARAELLGERVAMLEAPKPEPVTDPVAEVPAARPWWKLWGILAP